MNHFIVKLAMNIKRATRGKLGNATDNDHKKPYSKTNWLTRKLPLLRKSRQKSYHFEQEFTQDLSINMTKIFDWNLNGANTKEVVVDLPGLVSDGIDGQCCGTCLRGKLCLETTLLPTTKEGLYELYHWKSFQTHTYSEVYPLAV